MAIKNASDLLVYKKSPADVAQVTRIRVRSTLPLNTSGTVKVLNTADGSGVNVAELEAVSSANDGSTVVIRISNILVGNGYTSSTTGTDGDFVYRDYTNTFAGDLDNVLSVADGTATIEDGAIIIEVLTTGETNNKFEPIGHSTSASISFSKDLRDVTTKDSNGYQENVSGLSSFELSTDALQDINTDLEFKDFFDDINNTNEVTVKFAERGSGTQWEGNGFITSVSLDAGVEDNTTYSVSITGTAAVTKGTY
tara:strand:- start:256 stop:1014 length:759 start_codon:yes stop_codon:yes gene_type:complete